MYSEREKKEIIDGKINNLIRANKSNEDYTGTTEKNLFHAMWILGNIAILPFLLPLMARLLPSIVVPALGAAALNISAATSIVKNLMKNKLEKDSVKKINEHLEDIKENDLKVSEQITLDRVNAMNALEKEYTEEDQSLNFIKTLSYLGLTAEVVGAFLSLIYTPIAIGLIISGLGINLLSKKFEYDEEKTLAEIERKLSNISNDFNLSSLFVKYKKNNKQNTKTKVTDKELDKELTKNYRQEDIEKVDEIIKGLENVQVDDKPKKKNLV